MIITAITRSAVKEKIRGATLLKAVSKSRSSFPRNEQLIFFFSVMDYYTKYMHYVILYITETTKPSAY